MLHTIADLQTESASSRLDTIREARSYMDEAIFNYDQSRLGKSTGRSKFCFHPSELYMCKRRLWYCYAGINDENTIEPSLQEIFDIGHNYHAIVQRKVLKAIPAAGGEFYSEVPVGGTPLGREWEIQGSADGLIIAPTFRMILEIKTISEKGISTLSKPQAPHITQASIYATLLDAPLILFYYISKQNGRGKQFVVQTEKASFAEVTHTIDYVRNAIARQQIPQRMTKKYACKTCPFAHTCFDDKEWGDFADVEQ